jgi:polyisoprenoid-binding protein YceI
LPERNPALSHEPLDKPPVFETGCVAQTHDPLGERDLMTLFRTLLVATALSSSLLACGDPAKDVPKATTDSAKPVSSVAAKTPAKSASAAVASASAATSAGPTTPAVAVPEKPANALTLDPANSKIDFTGSKVTGKHDGKFEKFTGWLAVGEGDKVESTKVFLDIDVGSLKTDDGKLDGHLKTADFFDVEKFPKATFVTTEITPGGEKGATHTVTGNLKIRDVEKSVKFPAKIEVTKDKATAKAESAINRKDWGIVYEGKKDDLIREDVVIKLDLNVKR